MALTGGGAAEAIGAAEAEGIALAACGGGKVATGASAPLQASVETPSTRRESDRAGFMVSRGGCASPRKKSPVTCNPRGHRATVPPWR